MASINLIQAKPFTLLEPIGTTETEISVKDFVDIYGNQIVMSGTEQYCTIEPTSLDNQEIISFTDIVIVSGTVSKLTGVTRGLDAQPDPVTGLYGSSPTQAKQHAGNKICILSDNPQVWDKKTSKDEDETITGNWTFNETITVPTPILGSDAATKDYADSLTYAGTPDASTTTKGASRLSASPTVTLGTCTITIASPGVITLTSHGLTLNDSVEFTTTGTLPTGIVASTKYFVISSGLTADTFQISDTFGGSAIDTSVGQSGTHTLYKTTPVAYGKNDTTVMTQIKAQAQAELYGTDVGGDDTYAVALTPALTSYTNGSRLSFTPSTTNTGACTVDFGPSVLNIKTKDGADPQNGVIRASKPVTGTVFSGTFILDNEDFSTSTNHGTIQIATDVEAQAGVETFKAITPYQYQNTERNVLPQVLGLDGTSPLLSCAVGGFSSSEPFFTASTVSASYPLLHRFLKQKDGSIKMTHRIVMSWAAVNSTATLCVIGSYVYVCGYTGSAMVLNRYDKDDLTNGTNITISGTALQNQYPLFTDGTDLWQVYVGSALKYTISGTTATSGATRNFTSISTNMPVWCDGTTLWGGNMSTGIYKWTFSSGGAGTAYSGIVSTGNYLVATAPQSSFGGIMKDSTLPGKLYTFLAGAVGTICSGRFHVIDTF